MSNSNTLLTTLEQEYELVLENIVNKSFNVATDYIKEKIEELEDLIFKHPLRKKQYAIKDNIERTILTSAGYVTFKRRLYIEKLTGDKLFLLDLLLKIKPYSRISDEAILKIAQNGCLMKSYSQAAKYSIPNTIISKQTVANCIDKVKVIQNENIKKVKTNTIYIAIDGFFANYKEFDRKIETKFANIYTDKDLVGKKRYKLLNKMVITCKDNTSFLYQVTTELFKNYDVNENTKIYICGDGAAWIKQFASNFKNAEFVIDKFHLIRAAKTLPRGVELVDAILKQDYSMIMKEIKELCIEEKDQVNYRYIELNLPYVKGWFKDDFVGVMAENVVSHVFNHRIRSIPRNWGRRLKKVVYALAKNTTNKLKMIIEENENAEYLYNEIDDLFLPHLDLIRKYHNDYDCPVLHSSCSKETKQAFKSLLYEI